MPESCLFSRLVMKIDRTGDAWRTFIQMTGLQFPRTFSIVILETWFFSNTKAKYPGRYLFMPAVEKIYDKLSFS